MHYLLLGLIARAALLGAAAADTRSDAVTFRGLIRVEVHVYRRVVEVYNAELLFFVRLWLAAILIKVIGLLLHLIGGLGEGLS